MSIDYEAVGGGKQTKVTVKKGDQSWVVAANELDKLPEEVRAIATQYVAARQAISARDTLVAFDATDGAHIRFSVAGGVALPDDVTITVTRHGSEPAKLNVKKGDQSWDVTENDLAKLPDDIRRFAELSLGRGIAGGHGTVRALGVPVVPPHAAASDVHYRVMPMPGAPVPATPHAPPMPGALAPTTVRSFTVQRDVDRQLKELTEQVDKLRIAVEKLQPKP
jgi:hypothetical protein